MEIADIKRTTYIQLSKRFIESISFSGTKTLYCDIIGTKLKIEMISFSDPLTIHLAANKINSTHFYSDRIIIRTCKKNI